MFGGWLAGLMANSVNGGWMVGVLERKYRSTHMLSPGVAKLSSLFAPGARSSRRGTRLWLFK